MTQHSDQPLSYQSAARFLNGIVIQMRDAEKELRTAHETTAQAEYDYRQAQARAWATAEGTNALQREASVQAACAEQRKARDLGRYRIDAAKMAFARLEREASSVRFLGEWAKSQTGSAV
jgi:hypothetical protein